MVIIFYISLAYKYRIIFITYICFNAYKTLPMFDFLPLNSIIQLITAIAAIGTIGLLWKFRQTFEVRFLIFLELFVAIWAISYALEFSTSELQEKLFFSQLSYLGIAFIPVCFFFFTTSFSQKFHLVSKRNIILTLIVPIVTLILVFSNPLHHLIWQDYRIDSSTNILHYEHGFWFWIFYVYTFVLIVYGIFNLISSISHFTSFYRKQIRILLIAAFIPVIANLMYVFKLNPFPGFDWTPVSFVLTGLVIALGIFRYKIFELIPLAQEKLLDTMNDGVMVVNANGIIEAANPALLKIFHLNKKETIHTPFQLIFQNYPEILKMPDSGNDKHIDLKLNEANETRFYQIKLSTIVNQLGQLNGHLFIFNDITSIRAAEQKLKQKNKLLKAEIRKNEKLIDDLDAYAHTLAHDLKNSLGLIYTSSDIILEAIEDEDMSLVEEYSKVVQESALKTIKVTNELLKMATAGHEDVETASVDMERVYNAAIKQLAPTIEEYHAELTIKNDWINAEAYAPWLEEVWVNLLSNAMKYGGDPPKIVVGCEDDGNGMVKFWIKDNGDGIPGTQHHKIFRKHTRLQPDKATGYGLGLSIVKRITEKLGGEVGVESSGQKGAGAVFYFKLPLATQE